MFLASVRARTVINSPESDCLSVLCYPGANQDWLSECLCAVPLSLEDRVSVVTETSHNRFPHNKICDAPAPAREPSDSPRIDVRPLASHGPVGILGSRSSFTSFCTPVYNHYISSIASNRGPATCLVYQVDSIGLLAGSMVSSSVHERTPLALD
jgi:hypothetical protein